MGHLKSARQATRSTVASVGRYTRPFSLRLQDTLTERVFPRVVAVLTHPYMISLTMLLIVPLIALGSIVEFVLLGNTYLNVASASVSMIVLYQSLHHQKQIHRMHSEAQSERTRIEKQHAGDIAQLSKELGDLRNELRIARALDAAKSQPTAKKTASSRSTGYSRKGAKNRFDPNDPIEE